MCAYHGKTEGTVESDRMELESSPLITQKKTITSKRDQNERVSTGKGDDQDSSPTEFSLTHQSQNSTIRKGYIKFKQKVRENETNEPEQPTGHFIRKVAPNTGNGFDEKEYCWYQTLNHVMIKISLRSSKMSEADVKIDLKEDQLSVKLKDMEELIFDQIKRKELIDEGRYCFKIPYELTKTDLVITLIKKKRAMWCQLDSNGAYVDIEKINLLGMKTQFVSIDSAETITKEIIGHFNDFPTKPKWIISVHGSINTMDEGSIDTSVAALVESSLEKRLSTFVEMRQDILIVTDGKNTRISKLISNIIKNHQRKNIDHANILAIAEKQDLQPSTTNSDVIHIDYDEDNETTLNCYHRWFIFVNGDKTQVKDLRMAIESRLSEVLGSCVCMLLLGVDKSHVSLMESYRWREVPIILELDAHVYLDNDLKDFLKRKEWDANLEKNLEHETINSCGLRFSIVPFMLAPDGSIFDNMFTCPPWRKSAEGLCNLIIHLFFKMSVKITPFERARMIVKHSLSFSQLIKYLDMQLSSRGGFFELCKKEDFRCLRETLYLLHYAVYVSILLWHLLSILRAGQFIIYQNIYFNITYRMSQKPSPGNIISNIDVC